MNKSSEESKEKTNTATTRSIIDAAQNKSCTEGDCENGKGTYKYNSGETYVGEFKNGIREGAGTMTYKNGDIFEGKFLKGKRHGYGSYTFANGEKYLGEFWSGEMKGLGNYIYLDGSILKGDFEEDGKTGGGTLLKKGQSLKKKGKDCRIENRKVFCHN